MWKRAAIGLCMALCLPAGLSADDRPVPTERELIARLQDETEADPQDALDLLQTHYQAKLSAESQRQLLKIFSDQNFSDRKLPNAIHQGVLEIWAKAPDVLVHCKSEIASLKERGGNRAETDEIRINTFGTLWLIDALLPGELEISPLFLKILKDRTESLELRKSAGKVFDYSLTPTIDSYEVIAEIISNREDAAELRLQLMLEYPSLQQFVFPEQIEPLAALMMKLGLDESESVEIREAALASFASLVSHARLEGWMALATAADLLRQSVHYAANWKEHLRSLMDRLPLIGSKPKSIVLPASHSGWSESADLMTDLLRAAPSEFRGMLIKSYCYSHGKLFESSRGYSRQLAALLGDRNADRKIREAAGSALGVVDCDEGLAGDLRQMLQAEETFLHEYAADVLGGIGIKHQETISLLIAMWTDPNEPAAARAAAERALRQLAPNLTLDDLAEREQRNKR